MLALVVGDDPAPRWSASTARHQPGPTDLRVIQSEVADNSATGLHDHTGGRWAHDIAAAAFGEDNLARHSAAALTAGSLSSTRCCRRSRPTDPLVSQGALNDYGREAQLAGPG